MLRILSILVVLSAVSAQAETASTDKNKWYVTGGVGISSVEPDMGTSGYTLDDDQDTGFKISVGKEISPRFFAEMFYSDLGEAALDNQGNATLLSNGTVEYSLMGVSGLMFPFVDAAKGKSKLEPYLQVGLASLDTGGNVDTKNKNSTQIAIGAGFEYSMHSSALRLFYDSYDADAALMGVSYLKRFGVPKRARPEKVRAEVKVAEVPAPIITEEKLEDVLLDSNLRSIGFAVGSANLTDFSKGVLDKVALFLIEQEAVSITIIAHTDDAGKEGANLRLSKERSASVLTYLASKGVTQERMTAKGYGEYDPIATNDTEEGRETNRRVEFLINK